MLLLLLLPSLAVAAPCGSSSDLLPDPYGMLVRGEEALLAGNPAGAEAELVRVEGLPAGPAQRRHRQLLGRARLEQGKDGTSDLKAALVGVHKVGARVSRCDADPAETRWWLAQAERSDQHLRDVWTHNPTSSRTADVERTLASKDAGFGQVLEGRTPASHRELVESRAAALAKMHQHKDALALIEGRLPDDGTKAWSLSRARALFRAKDYPRAVAAWDAITDLPIQDRFDRALATSRTGDYASAAVLYDAIVQGDAGQKLADSASYKLGYLAWDGGDLEGGVDAFRAHLKRYPKTKHRTEALWFVGWSLFKLDRLDEAAEAFTALIDEHPRSTLVPGARYWKARIAGLKGDVEQERAGYEQVLVRHSDTSYAWWSSRRLGRTWSAPSNPQAPIGTVFKEEPRLMTAYALQKAGLQDWAAAELKQLESAAKKKGRDHTLFLAQSLAEAGQWKRAKALARPWCSTPEARKDMTALRLCWPRPMGDEAMARAREGGLPPHLPFAIMKAESGFNPTVTSAAGARGLMQMMPKLGVALWSELHGEELDPERLYDPAVNAELGVTELLQLRASLESTGVDPIVPLVIAGYNGGADAVRRWLIDQPLPVEADRWAEDISYSETRRYVRRVLGALQVYRYVYGDR